MLPRAAWLSFILSTPSIYLPHPGCRPFFESSHPPPLLPAPMNGCSLCWSSVILLLLLYPLLAPPPPSACSLWGHHHLVRRTGFGKADCGAPPGSTPAPRRSLLHRPRRRISLLSLNVHVVTGQTGAGAQTQNRGGSFDQVDLEVKQEWCASCDHHTWSLWCCPAARG